MLKFINICGMLGQHYHTKIDHLAIGTEKIISFSENKKSITLTIQGHTITNVQRQSTQETSWNLGVGHYQNRISEDTKDIYFS